MSWTTLFNNSTTVSNGSDTPPYDQDYFSVKTPTPQPQIQFNIGYRWHEKREFIPYYSAFFQYRHYFISQIRGNIYQYSSPEFENYDYQMDHTADLFTLNGKINLFEYKKFLPYLSAGAGVIYNYLNNYREFPLENVTPRTSAGYSSKTNANLALTLGIGIDFKINKNTWATLGYEYLAQGNLFTGPGDTTWSDTHLTFGKNVKTRTVFLNISMNIPDGMRSDQ